MAHITSCINKAFIATAFMAMSTAAMAQQDNSTLQVNLKNGQVQRVSLAYQPSIQHYFDKESETYRVSIVTKQKTYDYAITEVQRYTFTDAPALITIDDITALINTYLQQTDGESSVTIEDITSLIDEYLKQ